MKDRTQNLGVIACLLVIIVINIPMFFYNYGLSQTGCTEFGKYVLSPYFMVPISIICIIKSIYNISKVNQKEIKK